jgi:type II secretory pathway pseudopilin PulG
MESSSTPNRDQAGFSLVETMVAMCLLLVVTAGVLPLSVVAFRISENHGHLLARSTEYAQDKLEQLMALSYGDVVTDTRTFPAGATGGTGLAPGGTTNTATPPAGWYYQRVWSIEEVGAADPGSCPVSASAAQKCLKRITVTATVRLPAQGGNGVVPSSTVTALKSYPF